MNNQKTYLPDLTVNEVCAFLKLNCSLENSSEFFTLAQNVPKFLKLFICGNSDPLVEKDKNFGSIYHLINYENKFN